LFRSHTHVVAAFHQYEIDTPPKRKQALANTICLALEVHAQLEEEIFYPAMQALKGDSGVVEKSIPEHNEMRRLIEKLRSMESTDPMFDKTVAELMRDVLHHVADEETVLLPDAERMLGDQLRELGAKMTRRRLQLMTPKAGQVAVNLTRALPASTLLLTVGAIGIGAMLIKSLSRRSLR
ncbi:MAG: hemerythrin protein, partial [Rhizobacter sp.]|nr:hemerythrin protein [Rhizobacter sp.]